MSRLFGSEVWCRSIRRALLLVDQVGDLEVQCEVRLEVLGVAGLHCYTVSLPRHAIPQLPYTYI